jgi:hypothetical protein
MGTVLRCVKYVNRKRKKKKATSLTFPMGQAISSSSSGENNGSKTQCSTPIPAPPVNSYLMKMAERPPVHCCFYYENQCKEGQIRMPLLYQLLPDNKGTRLMDLELWLRDQFNIPKGSSVFAVIPATELYCTPYPLVMINTIVSRLYADFENERVPVLHFALVVRGMSLLKQPIPHADAQESPFFAISATALAQKCDSIERKFARMRFVQNMKTYGFARIVVTPEQAQIPQEAFKTVRVWLKDQLELSQNKRWRDWVDATRPPHNFASNSEENIEDSSKEMSNPPNNTHPLVSSGRYVGFNEDANREYLQLRLPIAKSGTLWPPNYFEDDKAKEFAMKMLELLCLLDGLGRNCMEAVCEILNLDPKWMFEELLDDPKTPPSTEEEIQSIDKTYQYGASVLRIYNYRNKGANGEKAHPYDPSCGVVSLLYYQTKTF